MVCTYKYDVHVFILYTAVLQITVSTLSSSTVRVTIKRITYYSAITTCEYYFNVICILVQLQVYTTRKSEVSFTSFEMLTIQPYRYVMSAIYIIIRDIILYSPVLKQNLHSKTSAPCQKKLRRYRQYYTCMIHIQLSHIQIPTV